jgi:hypothetical protein
MPGRNRWTADRFGSLPWILAGAFVLRVLLFTGLTGTDDVLYASRAHALLHSGFDRSGDLFAARIGYVFPLAVVFSIFGVSQASDAILSLASSMLLVWLAWKLGRALGGERLAIVAAVMAAALPLDIYYSTNGHLDLVHAAVASLALYLLWRSGRLLDHGVSVRYAVLSGVLFGIAYLIKETTFIFFIPALWLARRRPYRSRLAIALVTHGLFVAAEMTTYAIVRGDALARIHLSAAQVDMIRPSGGGSLWPRVTELASGFLSPEGGQFLSIGVVAWLALAGTLVVVWRERERWGWVAVWPAAVVVVTGFWPLTLHPYRPALGLYVRFFAGLTVPAALLAAQFFTVVSARFGRPIRWLGLGAIVALNLLCAVVNHEDAVRFRAGPEWAHRVLAASPGSIVVTDPRTRQMLLFLAGYEPAYEIRMAAGQPPPSGAILLDNEGMVAREREWDGATMPAWWSAPMPHRQRIAQTSVPQRPSLRGRSRPPENLTLSRVVP